MSKMDHAETQRPQSFDQYTRWLCKHCGKDGIDSWNKGVYDGIDWGDGEPDNPHIIGGDCMRCDAAVMVVAYYGPDEVPHAIYGPVPVEIGQSVYDYEAAAFEAFANDLKAGEPLEPSTARDMDWRGGCTNLRASAPLREAE